MYDKIVKSGQSQLQYGPNNNRIYLMHLASQDMPGILDTLDHMANTHGYTKVFAKIPEDFSKSFLENGYVIEATVPDYYKGETNCIFLGKYRDEKRKSPVDGKRNNHVIETALSKKPLAGSEYNLSNDSLPSGFYFKKTELKDAKQMARLYAKVFDSYPFPVFEAEYIEETMNDNVVYFSIWKEDEIVALSSCEMYIKDESVEMTDFAVLPAYRGQKFSYFLLHQMEEEMKKNKIKTSYTIARSSSYGMNNTFARCGYDFSGTLIKNTQIGGEIEDMNVWYKSLI